MGLKSIKGQCYLTHNILVGSLEEMLMTIIAQLRKLF